MQSYPIPPIAPVRLPTSSIWNTPSTLASIRDAVPSSAIAGTEFDNTLHEAPGFDEVAESEDHASLSIWRQLFEEEAARLTE
jgi:hypothetical protein